MQGKSPGPEQTAAVHFPTLDAVVMCGDGCRFWQRAAREAHQKGNQRLQEGPESVSLAQADSSYARMHCRAAPGAACTMPPLPSWSIRQFASVTMTQLLVVCVFCRASDGTSTLFQCGFACTRHGGCVAHSAPPPPPESTWRSSDELPRLDSEQTLTQACRHVPESGAWIGTGLFRSVQCSPNNPHDAMTFNHGCRHSGCSACAAPP